MRNVLITMVLLAGIGAAGAQMPANEAPGTRALPDAAGASEPAIEVDPGDWQASINGQIEAFRDADGVAALEFAGQGFKAQFKDPEVFYQAILRSGYEAIVNSRSHSFGEFEQVSETFVVQVVRFVGPDQGLYEAFYQMLNEDDGWRVQGVALRQDAGVGI